MLDKQLKEELNQLLDRRSTALVAGNLEFFENILADDFCYTNASGKVFNKATYLEFFIESEMMQWQSQVLDELTIQLYSNMAVVTCRIFDQASYQGQAFAGHFRSTQVFIRKEDAWQYVAGQTTTIE